jgi:phage terminase large subunit-like protein
MRRLDLFSLGVSPGSEEERFLDATLVDNPSGALLSHAKVLRVSWRNGSAADTYVCVTSANLSPTAWGSSWECGVLVAGQRAEAVDLGGLGKRYRSVDKWM